MAPEMDQFYRSTMAIYKVSACPVWAPSQGSKFSRLWKTEREQGGSLFWERRPRPGWAELWVWGWGPLGAASHSSPNLSLPEQGFIL